MTQMTFSDIEYSNNKKTKRRKFLESMNKIIPWSKWVSKIEPYYYKNERGRKSKNLEMMLRMYLMQNWFNMSDEGIEDEIYESHSMKEFLGIDFLQEGVPDATTLLKFRRIIENNKLGEAIFRDVAESLKKSGLMMNGGSIVDATIIKAPSSTKNIEGKRDSEMHQTKKGGNWHFGMKVHMGVDAGSGYVHTIKGTSANMHDITQAHELIRADDEVVYGDSGYIGIQKRQEIMQDEKLRKVEYRITKRPSSLKISSNYKGINWDKEIERKKSSIRCKVEHPFLIVKKLFGYSKVVYKGIEKNMNRFNILFASANLLNCVRANRAIEFCGI